MLLRRAGFGRRVSGFGFGVRSGLGIRVQGVELRIQGLGFRLVFKAHRLWHHSTLGLIVIKKKFRVHTDETHDELGAPLCGRPFENVRIRHLLAVWGYGLGVGVLLINVRRFREGLVFEDHRLLYHSTLGVRVIKKKTGVQSTGFRDHETGPRT